MGYFGRDPGLSVGQAAVAVGCGGVMLLTIGMFIANAVGVDDGASEVYAPYDVSSYEDTSVDAVMVCSSPDDITRVDDNLCGDYGDDGNTIFTGGYHYMFFDARAYKGDVPAVGQKLPTGKPAGYVRTYKMDPIKVVPKAPVTGGKPSTIQRGGFGVPNSSSGTKSGSTAGGVKAGTSGGS